MGFDIGAAGGAGGATAANTTSDAASKAADAAKPAYAVPNATADHLTTDGAEETPTRAYQEALENAGAGVPKFSDFAAGDDDALARTMAEISDEAPARAAQETAEKAGGQTPKLADFADHSGETLAGGDGSFAKFVDAEKGGDVPRLTTMIGKSLQGISASGKELIKKIFASMKNMGSAAKTKLLSAMQTKGGKSFVNKAAQAVKSGAVSADQVAGRLLNSGAQAFNGGLKSAATFAGTAADKAGTGLGNFAESLRSYGGAETGAPKTLTA